MSQAIDPQATPLTPEQQQRMNAPAVDPTGMDADVDQFLHSTMQKVYAGEINLFSPSSLLNQDKYEALTEPDQGKIDQKAILFCTKLREIKGLMDISGGDVLYAKPTYQIQQLVHELKMHKEEVERQLGDVFVI